MFNWLEQCDISRLKFWVEITTKSDKIVTYNSAITN